MIKGEIVASDPVYVYGSVEGSINAPEHRVTIGKEGRVKADITAREIVIMGDVCGNLEGGERVEIRGDGSLMGNMATRRIYIEEGAVLSGSIDVHKPSKKEKAEAREEQDTGAGRFGTRPQERGEFSGDGDWPRRLRRRADEGNCRFLRSLRLV